MAMTNHHNRKNDCMIFSTIEQLVPQNHLVRKLEKTIDWSFIYAIVEDLYSDIGRPSIDPVVLFKMIFINYLFGINSMRKTCEEIKVNLAYRWFLGISIDDEVPNYSTWSQNYIRRYNNSEVFDEIFKQIIRQAIKYNFVDVESIYGDSTHQKASANKRKAIDIEVAIAKKYYEEDLKAEINNDREAHGKKRLKEIITSEYNYDEETGEIKEDKIAKHIKQSTTDPESGLYHKGEKEKCFAYSHQTFCDKNGFVLASKTISGNTHDSVSFKEAYNEVIKEYEGIKNVGLDSGYKTAVIARDIIESGKKPYFPYKRPMTKKRFFKKYEYVYDEAFDCYLCPNNKILSYTTTNSEGRKEYKSNPKDCEHCPLLTKCTLSKNHIKVVQRHVWEEYLEEAEDIRHTVGYHDIYDKRKETIERVFADSKESHGLRYTRLRGLKKNQHQVLIIFASHNLKKMANWSHNKVDIYYKTIQLMCSSITISLFSKKKLCLRSKSTTLSTV